MTEREFINSFDCRFPYEDGPGASAFIRESLAFSANATFAIVYELMQPPHDSTVTAETCLRLLAEVDAVLTHPLKEVILSIARRCVQGQCLSNAEAVGSMRGVARFRDAYAALGIVYCAADPDDASVEAIYQELVRSWEAG